LTNNFGKHPSKKLQEAFSQRPFQIQEPEKAKIIFLGRDANLDYNIEQDKHFFREITAYLMDGVAYWKSNGFHSPMLKPDYKGKAGEKYHREFGKLKFTPANAEHICFLELLNCCTYGNSSKHESEYIKLLNEDANKNHLERIKNLYKMDNIICIPKGLKRIIDKLKLFDTGNEKIVIHTHFSNAISNNELCTLGEKLLQFISKK
jgi:hypothetical protein